MNLDASVLFVTDSAALSGKAKAVQESGLSGDVLARARALNRRVEVSVE